MESYPEQKLEKEWIRTGVTPDIIDWTKSFGEFLSKNEDTSKKKALTTGQLRKFFGEVKRIDSDVVKHKADIAMLKPLLAYAVGRDKKKEGKIMVNKTRIEEFEQELCRAIDAIRMDAGNEELKSDYHNFVQIFESIVAFHKYFGGQENSNN